MQTILIFLIFGLVAAMLFLNLYFRVKVLKVYKRLVQNKVDFNTTQIFNKKKMEAEVYSRYPQHRQDIETFVQHIFYSVRMATILMALITALGAVLMWYR